MIKMLRIEILNLETKNLLFCPFLVSHCKLDILGLILLTKSLVMLITLSILFSVKAVRSDPNLVNSAPPEQNQMDFEDINFVKSDPWSPKLKNSDILKRS